MNRDDLINSFDAVTPTEAQKEKMLKNVLSRRETRNVVRMNFKRYGAALVGVAAVLTLTIGYVNFGIDKQNDENYNTVGMVEENRQTEMTDGGSDRENVDVQVNKAQVSADLKDNKNTSERGNNTTQKKSEHGRQVAMAAGSTGSVSEIEKNSDKTGGGAVTQGSSDVIPNGARAVQDNGVMNGRSKINAEINDENRNNDVGLNHGNPEEYYPAVYMSDDGLCYTDDVADGDKNNENNENDENDELDDDSDDVLSEPIVPGDGRDAESGEDLPSDVTLDEDVDDLVIE